MIAEKTKPHNDLVRSGLPWVSEEERRAVQPVEPLRVERVVKDGRVVGVQLMKRDYGETIARQRHLFPWWYCRGVWNWALDFGARAFGGEAGRRWSARP